MKISNSLFKGVPQSTLNAIEEMLGGMRTPDINDMERKVSRVCLALYGSSPNNGDTQLVENCIYDKNLFEYKLYSDFDKVYNGSE